jgi:DNA/RNA-binding protein KIN17
MSIVSENTGSFINSYSKQFEKEFMDLVRTRWKSKKVHVNVVYNEFVSHRLHTHMNSTQWTTLTEFVK